MKNLIIITGTTRGLGMALVTLFYDSGWDVLQISRPQFDLAKLDLVAVENLFSSIDQNRARILLLHNAGQIGLGPANSIGDIAGEVMDVNLVSAIKLTSLFLAKIPAGEVATITSGAATMGIAHWSLYCASKAGLSGFMRALAAESVRTFEIEPGIIDTDMQRQIRESGCPLAPDFIAAHQRGELRSPEDVAAHVFASINPASDELRQAS